MLLCPCQANISMTKYGVYVYDLLKILGGVCPEGKQSKSNIQFQY